MNYGFPPAKKTVIKNQHKILFYEMSDHYRYNNVRYYRVETRLRRVATGEPVGPSVLGYGANRIWCWDPETDEVKYVKNRQTGIMTSVDLKEFLMVQMQAVKWKNETA